MDRTTVDRDATTGEPRWLLDGDAVYAVIPSDLMRRVVAAASRGRWLSALEEAGTPDIDGWERLDDERAEVIYTLARLSNDHEGRI
jgi:hypothetical protein